MKFLFAFITLLIVPVILFAFLLGAVLPLLMQHLFKKTPVDTPEYPYITSWEEAA